MTTMFILKRQDQQTGDDKLLNFFTESFRIKDLAATISLDKSCFMVYT